MDFCSRLLEQADRSETGAWEVSCPTFGKFALMLSILFFSLNDYLLCSVGCDFL
jgi:hypothetical protein